MAEGSGKAREISLGEDFGGVVVNVNGARIEVGADSHVAVTTRGGVELRLAANDVAEPKLSPKVGEVMTDGTVYAGISPDTGRAMYPTATHAPRTHTFHHARNHP